MERRDTADTWLDMPPTPRQTRWALAVTAVVLAGFAAVVPISGRPLVELNAFFPSLDAIVFVSDLVTAVLLYAQFSISRSRALLALATGYLFTALIVIPHALTFAGAFFADRTARSEHPDRIVALHLLAHRLCGRAARLCGAEGRTTRCARS